MGNEWEWETARRRMELKGEVTSSIIKELQSREGQLRQSLKGFSYGGPVLDDQGKERKDYCWIRIEHAQAIMDWLQADHV